MDPGNAVASGLEFDVALFSSNFSVKVPILFHSHPLRKFLAPLLVSRIESSTCDTQRHKKCLLEMRVEA